MRRLGTVAAVFGAAILFMAVLSASTGAGRAQNTNSSSTMNSNTNASMNSNSNSNSNASSNSNRSSDDQMTSRNKNSGMDDGKMMSLSSTDKKFMMTAAAGGMAEVAMGRMALERASSDAVKQYAQKMIDDHTKAGDELKALAEAKGVALPTEPDAKHKALMAKMMNMSGAEFDRQYVINSGVKDHEKMEKLFRDQIRKGKDAETKAFASKTLPTVQMHLQMAHEMHRGMMGGAGNTNSSNMNH